jgi:hypothetical protein
MRKSVSLLLVATAALAQTPTGEQILDRYIEVTGGKTAYDKVRTEIVTGTMEMKAQGIKGKMTGYRNEKNESYNALEIEGVGKIEEGYHNGIAWEKSAMQGPRVKTGEEKAFFAREAVIGRDSRWRDLYVSAEFKGEETIAGSACYKVVLSPKDGSRPETRYYDKQTGLLKRVTMTMSTQMGDLPVESTFLEYREFGGLKAPVAIQTKMAGQEMGIAVTNVEYNQPIPAEKFVPPADVQALAAKSGKKSSN